MDDPGAEQALTRSLGQPLKLRRETDIQHHDQCAVHLITTASIRRVEPSVGGQIDPRRLRANIVLETEGMDFVEDAWSDAELSIGPRVLLRLGRGMPRCLMVDQPQADVPAEPPVLQALGREHDVYSGCKQRSSAPAASPSATSPAHAPVEERLPAHVARTGTGTGTGPRDAR